MKHSGNITFDEVIDISRQMADRSMSRKLAGTVKQILGTCQSVGCTVDGNNPHDMIDKINDGELEVPEVIFAIHQFPVKLFFSTY